MNRYILHGIARDAIDGKRVVCALTGHDVTQTLDAVAAIEPSEVAKVRRANGDAAVFFRSGGSVQFALSEMSLRGRSADVVCLSGHPRAGDDRVVASARAVVAASPCGEVIR